MPDSSVCSMQVGSLPVTEIGGYEVLEALLPESTYLAVAPGGRRVTLKMLDADCLLRRGLHPSIRERLGRVRELAHVGVANLCGVERDESMVYMVWEYIDGTIFADWMVDPGTSYRELLLMARELVLTVESMHARGIVHGSIHGYNAIIDERKRLRLTHVSPFLYSDPADDVEAVVALLRDAVERRGEKDLPLGKLLDAMQQSGELRDSLRPLASRLSSLIDVRDAGWAEQAAGEERADRRMRRRSMMGAVAVGVAAVALYLGIRQYASHAATKAPVPAPAAASSSVM